MLDNQEVIEAEKLATAPKPEPKQRGKKVEQQDPPLTKEKQELFDQIAANTQSLRKDKIDPEKPDKIKPEAKPAAEGVKPAVIAEVKIEEGILPLKVEGNKEEDQYAFIREILGEEAAPDAAKPKEAEKEKVVSKPAQAAVEPLDPIYNHPMVKAVAEAVKSGMTDLAAIASGMGLMDASKMTPQELFASKAKELGFEGEELNEAVQEDLEAFEGLTKIGKAEKLRQLRSEIQNKAGEKLESYTANLTKERAQADANQQKMFTAAASELRQTLESLDGKVRMNLKLDPTMIEAIEQVAPLLSTEVFDDNGNMTGYNVQEGIDLAIFKMYKPIIFKAIATSARALGYDEAMKEKARPNLNEGSEGIAPAVKSQSKEDLVKEAYAQKFKNSR